MRNGRDLRLLSALLGGVFATAVAILGSPSSAYAASSWYVATTGNDAANCLSPGTPCATINGVLAKAGFVSGDTVRVAAGTYTGTGSEVVQIAKNATLLGGWDSTFSAQTGTSTIDGAGTRRGVTIVGSITVVLDRFTIQNGFDAGSGRAGGIDNVSGTLTLRNSVIASNSATSSIFSVGGGIFNAGMLTMVNSAVISNISASDGGGIYDSGSATITDSTINGNTATLVGFSGAGGGGGINVTSGTLTVTNSTISNNKLLGLFHGSGIYAFGPFGAVLLTNTTVSGNTGGAFNTGGVFAGETFNIYNSTIANNQYFGLLTGGSGATVTLANTVIADNNGTADCFGGVTSSGYNIVENPGNCTLSQNDLTNLDPKLGPLQDNGGPTFTQALLSGSPAIDAVPVGANGCGTTLTSDQRGVTRPQGPACDVGAFEVAATDTTPPVITVPANITTTATSLAGATVNYTVSANDAVDGPVPVTCTPASGSTFAIGVTTVNCSANDKAGNIAAASFTITVTVTDTTSPTTPTNLATPVRGKTTMVLTWGASTDPDDTTLIYDVYVNDKKVGDTGGLRFQVQNLQCGMRYVFGVSARDKAGNVSGRVAKAQSTLLCG
jgi:hypothetical protein